jgi:hypothetical protein
MQYASSELHLNYRNYGKRLNGLHVFFVAVFCKVSLNFGLASVDALAFASQAKVANPTLGVPVALHNATVQRTVTLA